MIIIKKNNANTCIFTLNENQTSTIHDWVFVFTHDATGEVKTFTSTDLSGVFRFNEFIITDDPTENYFNGTCNFALGDHTYIAYEMAQTSPVNLDITAALAVVESGKVYVYDPNSDDTNYFSVDDTKNSGEFNEE